jgi:hypothetical protein
MREGSMSGRHLFVTAVLVLLVSGRASAQLPAAITGSVVDEKGKGLGGVQVTATSTTTTESRIAITTSRGGFRLSGLPPGTYRVEFDLAGYKKHVRTGVVLNVGFTANLHNLRLEAGAGPPTSAVEPAPAVLLPPPGTGADGQSRAENMNASLNGAEVTVSFDLVGPSTGPRTVRLLASLDAGTTFDFQPKSVSGDVGERVAIGTGKVIRWKAARDIERGDLSALRFRVVVE